MIRTLLAAAALMATCLVSARAAEIRVLSANVFSGVLDKIVIGFEHASGHKVSIAYATAGVIRARVQSGEPTDIVIVPRPMLDALAKTNTVIREGTVDVARSAVGVAVRTGELKPEIGTAEAVKQALRAAPSISYADPSHGGATGVLITRDFEELGIADEMRRKTRFPPEGQIAVELLARGEITLALAQTMEIIGQPGVELVGLLPADLQAPVDFTFSAGLCTDAKERPAAQEFLDYLQGPESAAVLRTNGMTPG